MKKVKIVLPIKETTIMSSFLDSIKKEYDNKICFKYLKDGTIVDKSYVDFVNEIFSISQTLKDNNITSRTFALLGENSYEWIKTFFSLILAKNVVVLIDKESTIDEISENLKRVNVTCLIYSREYADVALEIKKRDNINIQLMDKIEKVDKVVPYEKMEQCAENGVSIILFTSGTSGKSKIVMLSQKNILVDAYNSAKYVEYEKESIILLPLYHVFGLVASLIIGLLYGQTLYINQSIREILKELQLVRPYNLVVVPQYVEYFYKYFYEKLKFSKKEDLVDAFGGNLKYIISGGAPIEEKYLKFFHNCGIEILNGYGISECSPVVSVNQLHDNVMGSVGKIIPQCKVKIESPDTNGYGEICIQGENVMVGYFTPEDNQNAFSDGWFMTGDIGRMKKGKLYIKGRIKNLLILSNGKNVSAEEIEDKIRKIHYVIETMVYEYGGKIKAEVYLDFKVNENADKDIYIDIQKLNCSLPKYKNINIIEVRKEEFEKTSTGKVRRRKRDQCDK